MSKIGRIVWHALTAISGIFGIVWELSAQPSWWPVALSLAGIVTGFLLGKSWKPAEGP